MLLQPTSVTTALHARIRCRVFCQTDLLAYRSNTQGMCCCTAPSGMHITCVFNSLHLHITWQCTRCLSLSSHFRTMRRCLLSSGCRSETSPKARHAVRGLLKPDAAAAELAAPWRQLRRSVLTAMGQARCPARSRASSASIFSSFSRSSCSSLRVFASRICSGQDSVRLKHSAVEQ